MQDINDATTLSDLQHSSRIFGIVVYAQASLIGHATSILL